MYESSAVDKNHPTTSENHRGPKGWSQVDGTETTIQPYNSSNKTEWPHFKVSLCGTAESLWSKWHMVKINYMSHKQKCKHDKKCLVSLSIVCTLQTRGHCFVLQDIAILQSDMQLTQLHYYLSSVLKKLILISSGGDGSHAQEVVSLDIPHTDSWRESIHNHKAEHPLYL